MNQKELNGIAKSILPEYTEILKSCYPYQVKGVFHSEMLMFCAIITKLMPEQVIESGRARGQSTEIIGRWTESRRIQFHSIESNTMREDFDIANKRMRGIECNLITGDGMELMPKLVKNTKTLCLIDGPKGSNMWKLFQMMITMPTVQGVAMHDSYDGGTIRNNLQKAYRGKYLISDDEEFVKAFKYLDEECWAVHPFEPYQTGSFIGGVTTNIAPCKSYSGTLSFVEK